MTNRLYNNQHVEKYRIKMQRISIIIGCRIEDEKVWQSGATWGHYSKKSVKKINQWI